MVVAARVLTSGSGAKPNSHRWSPWDKPPSAWGSADSKHHKAGQLSRTYRPPVTNVVRPISARSDRHGLATHGVLGDSVDPISWKLKSRVLTPPSSPPSPPAAFDERVHSLQPVAGNRLEFGTQRLILDRDFSPALSKIAESESDEEGGASACSSDQGRGKCELLSGSRRPSSQGSRTCSAAGASRGSSRASARARDSAHKHSDTWVRPASRSSVASSRASTASSARKTVRALPIRQVYGRTRGAADAEYGRSSGAPRIGPLASGNGHRQWYKGAVLPDAFPGLGRSKAYPWRKEQTRRGGTPLGRPEHRTVSRPTTPASADIGVRRFKVGLMGGGATWDGLLGNSLGRVHRWVAVDVGPNETVLQVKAKVSRHPAYRALAAASAAARPAAVGDDQISRPVSRRGQAEAMVLVLPGGRQVDDDSAILHELVENGVSLSSGRCYARQDKDGTATPPSHNPLWAKRPKEAKEKHPLGPSVQDMRTGTPGSDPGADASETGSFEKLRHRLVTLYAGRGELSKRKKLQLAADKYFYDAALSNAAGKFDVNLPSDFLAEVFVSAPKVA